MKRRTGNGLFGVSFSMSPDESVAMDALATALDKRACDVIRMALNMLAPQHGVPSAWKVRGWARPTEWGDIDQDVRAWVAGAPGIGAFADPRAGF